jgi:3'-phosphoadenosine 5'-phosphosulfate sulfotransferase (PAPS reductase)/FAD synthetase
VFSQWVKGIGEKPIFVCHKNGSGQAEFCRLDRTQASEIRTELRVCKPDVRKLLAFGTPYVLFSGGKDSLCLLHYLKGIADECGVHITAIHADTTAGFPEVEKYVRKVCRILQIELHVVRPRRDFFETAKKWGIPGPKSRWCCETLKVAPIRRFLQGNDHQKIIFDGIRAAESSARSKYTPVWFHPSFKCLSASPIFYWSDKKVKSYIEQSGLPRSPAEKLGTSAECWCGAYQGRADFEALLSIHPEIFQKLVDVEKAQKGKYTFLYEKGKNIRLEALRSSAATNGSGKSRS